MDPEIRKAIKNAAQDRLMAYYRDRAWTVTDTRQNRPYDAVAVRDRETIYLEAKGTQSMGKRSSSPEMRLNMRGKTLDYALWGFGPE